MTTKRMGNQGESTWMMPPFFLCPPPPPLSGGDMRESHTYTSTGHVGVSIERQTGSNTCARAWHPHLSFFFLLRKSNGQGAGSVQSSFSEESEAGQMSLLTKRERRRLCFFPCSVIHRLNFPPPLFRLPYASFYSLPLAPFSFIPTPKVPCWFSSRPHVSNTLLSPFFVATKGRPIPNAQPGWIA